MGREEQESNPDVFPEKVDGVWMTYPCRKETLCDNDAPWRRDRLLVQAGEGQKSGAQRGREKMRLDGKF